MCRGGVRDLCIFIVLHTHMPNEASYKLLKTSFHRTIWIFYGFSMNVKQLFSAFLDAMIAVLVLTIAVLDTLKDFFVLF